MTRITGGLAACSPTWTKTRRTSLLSESYLATRRRDLGGDQADFVYTITKLAEEEA